MKHPCSLSRFNNCGSLTLTFPILTDFGHCVRKKCTRTHVIPDLKALYIGTKFAFIKHMNNEDFSVEELQGSPTWMKYAGTFGRCNRCQEMTLILASCCDGTISYEGSDISCDDLWDKIQDDITNKLQIKMYEIREADLKGN